MGDDGRIARPGTDDFVPSQEEIEKTGEMEVSLGSLAMPEASLEASEDSDSDGEQRWRWQGFREERQCQCEHQHEHEIGSL